MMTNQIQQKNERCCRVLTDNNLIIVSFSIIQLGLAIQ